MPRPPKPPLPLRPARARRKRACDHDAALLVETHSTLPRGGRSEVVVAVQAHCSECGKSLRFLGLPASWLPDAPHPAGTEDSGVDTRTVYLPALWEGGR